MSFNPDVHVPGMWRCAKCAFVLIQSTLNSQDGSVTARNEAGEHCPNDGAPMWRLTWKEQAQELGHRLEEMFEQTRGSPENYATFFYDLAAMLELPAQPVAPHRVWREQMHPRLRALLAKPALTADTIVQVNAFLTHMADRYRDRTRVRRFGITLREMSRERAMMHALATFDASQDMTGVAFGEPGHSWDRDAAHAMVDEEIQHWEAA